MSTTWAIIGNTIFVLKRSTRHRRSPIRPALADPEPARPKIAAVSMDILSTGTKLTAMMPGEIWAL